MAAELQAALNAEITDFTNPITALYDFARHLITLSTSASALEFSILTSHDLATLRGGGSLERPGV